VKQTPLIRFLTRPRLLPEVELIFDDEGQSRLP